MLKCSLVALAMVPGLFACTSADVVDAGDPSDLAAFEGGDATYSDLRAAGYDAVPGQYLVLFEAGRRLPAGDIEGRLSNAEVVQELERVRVTVVRMDYDDAMSLAALPGVSAVEPDWFAWASGRPRRPCAGATRQVVPTGVAAIGTSAATGTGLRLAVIDTGIDSAHSDLNVAETVDLTGTGGTGVDDNGHGTHVAGTVAATNDAVGVVGVAPDVDLYGVKVLDSAGSGTYSTVAAGLDWAVSNGMDVANLSLGGTSSSRVLHSAITSAHEAGVLLVVAAGNDAISATKEFPAAYDGEVLTVSAYDVTGGVFASFSNYGVPPIDVAAPGVGVCSTTRGGSWGTMDGTSMASPHVAGAVALYLENHPLADLNEVENALKLGAVALPDTIRHQENLASVTSF